MTPAPYWLVAAGLAGTERVLVEAEERDADNNLLLSVKRGATAEDRTLNFGATFSDDLPATPSAQWHCHPKLYNDGRSCDCRCGMADPDCLFPNLAVVNCGKGETCSKAGRCTTPE